MSLLSLKSKPQAWLQTQIKSTFLNGSTRQFVVVDVFVLINVLIFTVIMHRRNRGVMVEAACFHRQVTLLLVSAEQSQNPNRVSKNPVMMFQRNGIVIVIVTVPSHGEC